MDRIIKWLLILLVVTLILAQFDIALGTVTGLFAVMGGTVLGFAAINTIGNAIAGIIIMTNHPFRIGDRIYYQNEFLDLLDIGIIYTKLRTLDDTTISMANQELLKFQIEDFGRDQPVRRHVAITPGFTETPQRIEEILLEAARNTPDVLTDPAPYVWITAFYDYAVEHTLYVYTSDIMHIRRFDAALKRMVLETCQAQGLDISTPLLHKSTD